MWHSIGSSSTRNSRTLGVLAFFITSIISYPSQTVQAAKGAKELNLTSNYSINVIPNTLINKELISGRAIASWPANIPVNELRPVIIFLPGWDGLGSVNAFVSPENTHLVAEGYVTLAIGFDSNSEWISDIETKTLEGLNKLCSDTSIPANCDAVVLVGSSYGGAQNYWVIENLRNNGYDRLAGNKGKILGFLSEDAGYGAPGNLDNNTTGAFTRTGLANIASYSVAMIENLGDNTFPVDECTWGNCGARVLSNAHLVRGDTNVFSICPAGGDHGTRGFTNWNAWVISALKTIIHVNYSVPTFSGYTLPTLAVGNTCISDNQNTFSDVPATSFAWAQIGTIYSAGITSGCSSVPLNYCPDNSLSRAQMAIFLLKSLHGSSYNPPAFAVSSGFTDVDINYWAATWVKQLAAEGITSGCGGGNFCPDATVTRAQMAVFLLKAKNGSSYTPPAVGGSTGFGDVPTSYWAAAFIKQLAADGITSGCGGGNYCPDNAVTRAQMAVFLVKSFNLP